MPPLTILQGSLATPLETFARRLHELEVGEVMFGPISWGLNSVDGLKDFVTQYYGLRDHVYAKQGGILDLRGDDAPTDIDRHDARSVHIAAIENAVDGLRIVGCVRVILRCHPEHHEAHTGLRNKGLVTSAGALPAEELFPEEVPDLLGSNSNAFEVSRYIIRQPEALTRLDIALGLHRSITLSLIHI